MTHEFLQTTWFLLIFVLLAGYAVLDGFDLGVGMWHLFTRDDHERRLGLNAIGPFWDGNEVWLLTGGGALFAAFPPVYAVFGPTFYLPIMLLLTALIFRAVSLEFRSKLESRAWRQFFDWAFSLGSLVAALLFGVALGNVVRGLPIDAEQLYTGGFFNLLNPYALLFGVTGVVLLAMHGAAYMACKTEGDLRQRMLGRVVRCWVVFLVLFALVNVYTAVEVPRMFNTAFGRPVLTALFALLALAAVVYLPIAARKDKAFHAFLCSAGTILAGFGLIGVSMFPTFIPSSLEGGVTLSAFEHSSTKLTLTWMFGVAAVGVPIVLVYTAGIYWIFRGKVVLDDHSY